MRRTLVLMRHGQAADAAATDALRPLTRTGRQEASSGRLFLAARGLRPEAAVVSPAVRTRTTFELLAAGLDPILDQSVYRGGVDDLLEAVSAAPAEAATLVLVGHNPGLPALLHEVGDPATSDPAAWARVGRGFPTAAVAVLEVDADDWTLTPGSARLVAAHLPLPLR